MCVCHWIAPRKRVYAWHLALLTVAAAAVCLLLVIHMQGLSPVPVPHWDRPAQNKQPRVDRGGYRLFSTKPAASSTYAADFAAILLNSTGRTRFVLSSAEISQPKLSTVKNTGVFVRHSGKNTSVLLRERHDFSSKSATGNTGTRPPNTKVTLRDTTAKVLKGHNTSKTAYYNPSTSSVNTNFSRSNGEHLTHPPSPVDCNKTKESTTLQADSFVTRNAKSKEDERTRTRMLFTKMYDDVNSKATSDTTFNGRQLAQDNKTETAAGFRLTRRVKHLLKACRAEGQQWRYRNDQLQKKAVNLWGEMLMDEPHRLIYCPIQKVGSSFLKRVFGLLHLQQENVTTHKASAYPNCEQFTGDGHANAQFTDRAHAKAQSADNGHSKTQFKPLTLTPPSAQLRGGRCEHKRVNNKRQTQTDFTDNEHFKTQFTNMGHGNAANISVFDMSGVAVHRTKQFATLAGKPLQEMHRILTSPAYRKFLFVRDPYERLFSGYIDKLFLPTFETGAIARNVHRLMAWFRMARPGFGPAYDELFADFLRQNPAAMSVEYESHGPIGPRPLSPAHVRKQRLLEWYYSRYRGPVPFNPLVLFTQLSGGDTGAKWADTAQLRGRDDKDKWNVEKTYHGREQFLRVRSRRCFMDVTFADFLLYVTNDLQVSVNDHFTPMADKCSPCQVDFDFLGKLETFHDDVDFILRSAGINLADLSADNDSFDARSDVSIMRDITLRTFSLMQRHTECKSPSVILRRLWTTFQIRGYLSINHKFPFADNMAGKVSPSDFLHELQAAYTDSGPRELRKRQRKTAMLEAYYSLPRAILGRVESYVKRDCELFGYDCSIEARFPPSGRPPPVFHFDKLITP